MLNILSLIIPTKNRSRILESLLLKLNNQLGQFEVIIVDDASTDNTKKIVEKCSSKLKYNLVYLRVKENIGLPNARNLGIKHSNYEIIGFLDDDCIPIYNNLIIKAIKWLNTKNQNIIGIGGPIYFRSNKPRSLPRNEISKNKIKIKRIFKFIEYSFLNFYEKNYKLCFVNFLPGGNFFFKKKYIEKVGNFDPGFDGNYIHEDTDICLRLSKFGKLVSDPEMPVNHLGITYGGCRRKPEIFYSNNISNTIYLLSKHKKLTHKILLSIIINLFGILKILIFGYDRDNFFVKSQTINRINFLKLIFKAIIIGIKKKSISSNNLKKSIKYSILRF
ncbi:MAG: glycosyltransferase family 2 protein [Promethearchaeota archaeon]